MQSNERRASEWTNERRTKRERLGMARTWFRLFYLLRCLWNSLEFWRGRINERIHKWKRKDREREKEKWAHKNKNNIDNKKTHSMYMCFWLTTTCATMIYQALFQLRANSLSFSFVSFFLSATSLSPHLHSHHHFRQQHWHHRHRHQVAEFSISSNCLRTCMQILLFQLANSLLLLLCASSVL